MGNMNKNLGCFQTPLVTFLILMVSLFSDSVIAVRHKALAEAHPVQDTTPRHEQETGMIVRISEIEIYPRNLQEYNAILKEEAEASVRLEPGVVAIFPMLQKENLTQVRILEIYASRQDYEAHLKTPHFQKYKTTTLKMVKSLKLVDMKTIDAATMARMFTKMNRS